MHHSKEPDEDNEIPSADVFQDEVGSNIADVILSVEFRCDLLATNKLLCVRVFSDSEANI